MGHIPLKSGIVLPGTILSTGSASFEFQEKLATENVIRDRIRTFMYILIGTFSAFLAFPSMARRVTIFNLCVCGPSVLGEDTEMGGLCVRECRGV